MEANTRIPVEIEDTDVAVCGTHKPILQRHKRSELVYHARTVEVYTPNSAFYIHSCSISVGELYIRGFGQDRNVILVIQKRDWLHGFVFLFENPGQIYMF